MILFLSPKIHKSLITASTLHHGQMRKGDGLPYIVHPFAVAWIVARYTDDEDTIAAAFLHDVLEDVAGYTAQDMERDFGSKIVEMVRGVSEDKDASITKEEEKETWEERKRKYLDVLKNDSKGALLICCADKIHNLLSMMEAYKVQGETLWEKFNAPSDKKLWFYGEVLAILKEQLHNKIVEEFEKVYDEAKKLFSL